MPLDRPSPSAALWDIGSPRIARKNTRLPSRKKCDTLILVRQATARDPPRLTLPAGRLRFPSGDEVEMKLVLMLLEGGLIGAVVGAMIGGATCGGHGALLGGLVSGGIGTAFMILVHSARKKTAE